MYGEEICEGDICELSYGIPPRIFRFTVIRIAGGLGFDGKGGSPSSGAMQIMEDLLSDIAVVGHINEAPNGKERQE